MSGEKRNSTRQTKRIGVREVARLAEVAPITVSRALSFPSAVAPATRERIMAAVSSLGYIPNRVAGSLSSNQTRLIGAIIPTFQSSVATEFTGGMATVLRSRGYQLLLGGSNFSVDEEESLIVEFLARRADGIYLTGTTHTDRARHMLKESRVPVVEIASLDGEPIDMVVWFSNVEASFAMMRHLAGAGQFHEALADIDGRRQEDGIAYPHCGRLPDEKEDDHRSQVDGDL
jgi:LacI family gluconate utilization system Gnt-I transcriptional repressor